MATSSVADAHDFDPGQSHRRVYNKIAAKPTTTASGMAQGSSRLPGSKVVKLKITPAALIRANKNVSPAVRKSTNGNPLGGNAADICSTIELSEEEQAAYILVSLSAVDHNTTKNKVANNVSSHELSTENLAIAPRAYTTMLICLPFPEAATKTTAYNWIHRQTLDCVTQMPWLAGMIVAEEAPGKIRLDVNHNPLYTQSNYIRQAYPTQATLGFSFKELAEKGFPYPENSTPQLFAFEEAPNLVAGSDEYDTPVFKVQANFITGGVLISVMCHSAVLDQQHTKQIMNVLFNPKSKSRPKLPVHPMFLDQLVEDELADRLSKTDVSNLTQKCPEYQVIAGSDNLTGRFMPQGLPSSRVLAVSMFSFSDTYLAQTTERMRYYLMPELLVGWDYDSHDWVEQIDILTTFVWCHVTRARYPQLPMETAEQLTSQLWIPVNGRAMVANVKQSKDYIGNTFLLVPTKATVGELLSACHHEDRTRVSLGAFAKIAARLRRKFKSIDAKYVTDRMLLAKSCTDPQQFKAGFNPHEDRDLVWDNKSDLVGDLDFSQIPGVQQKQPTCVRMIHPSPANGVVVVQPYNTMLAGGQGKCEVQLSLWDDVMQRLGQSSEWNASFSEAGRTEAQALEHELD